MRPFAGTLLAVTLLAAACGGGTRSVFHPRAIDWKPCPPTGFQCGRLTVPVDYSKPGGGTLHLAVARLPASDPDRRIGAIFINPGGPGGSGVDAVEHFWEALGPEVQRRFDVVGWDPRGVAHSEQLPCATRILGYFGNDLNRDPTPSTVLRGASAWAADCAHDRLAPYVGTNRVVQDLDALREAVGDEKLTYVGVSYGTEIGIVYVHRYPKRVRAVVIDGVVDPAESGEEQTVSQAASWNLALTHFFAWCRATPSCPLESPKRTLARVAAGLGRQPARVRAGREWVTVSSTLLMLSTILSSYQEETYPAAADVLAKLAKGDRRPLEGITSLPAGSLGAAVYVECLDQAFPSPGGYGAVVNRARAEAPIAGVVGANINRPCAHWHFHDPVPTAYRYTGKTPVLVWGTTHDTSTPYERSVHAVKGLGNARLVTLDASRHTALGANECVTAVNSAYLLRLRVPSQRTRC